MAQVPSIQVRVQVQVLSTST